MGFDEDKKNGEIQYVKTGEVGVAPSTADIQ